MFGKQSALSSDDIKSGRFALLANFVMTNWPFDNKPSAAQSLEIVSKSLGYKSYAEAVSLATDSARPGFLQAFQIERNLQAQLPTKINETSFFDQLFSGEESPLTKFVKDWPLELINRWNYQARPCILPEQNIANALKALDKVWSNTVIRNNGFATNIESGTSAAGIIAKLNPSISMSELNELKIHQLIDMDLAESIMQDVMPLVFQTLTSVNVYDAETLVHATGMSMSDIWKLPRTESSFPQLYAQCRSHIINNVMHRDVGSLFIGTRNESGLYNDYASELSASLENYEPGLSPGEYFHFSINRDDIESESFKTYGWRGYLRSDDGLLLASAGGSYVIGRAGDGESGFDLISAVDETSDADVAIIDLILDVYQNVIAEEIGEEVDKSDINCDLFFNHGNVMTMRHWERSANARSGSGLDLLALCLNTLKKKYKRKIHLAALIEPYQYKNDYAMLPVLVEQHEKDANKISDVLLGLNTHPAVVGIYTREKENTLGLSTFTRYCGESYHATHEDEQD